MPQASDPWCFFLILLHLYFVIHSPTNHDPYLLINHLHLVFDWHASYAQGTPQLRGAFILQQFAVVLDDAVGLPGQLSLRAEGNVRIVADLKQSGFW